VLLVSQCIQLSAAFALAALVYWDVVRVWHILSLSCVTGTAQAFGARLSIAAADARAPRRHANAIALNSTQFNLARMVGPLLAGVALATLAPRRASR